MGKFAKRINQYAASGRARHPLAQRIAEHQLHFSSYQHGRTHAANVAADLARARGLTVHTIKFDDKPTKLRGARFDWFDGDPDTDYLFGTGAGAFGRSGFERSPVRIPFTSATDPGRSFSIRLRPENFYYGTGGYDERSAELARDLFYKPGNYIAGIDPIDGAGSSIGIFQRGGIDGREVHYLSFDPDQQQREFRRQVQQLASYFDLAPAARIIKRTFDPRNPGRQRGGRIPDSHLGLHEPLVYGEGILANFARYNDRFVYNPWEPSYFRWYVNFLDSIGSSGPHWRRLLPTLDQLRDGGGSYLAQLDRRFARHYFERPPVVNIDFGYLELSGTNRFVDEQRALSAFWREWWDRLLFGNSGPVPGED